MSGNKGYPRIKLLNSYIQRHYPIFSPPASPASPIPPAFQND
ncbi:hypothetical protein COO91_07080 [Nostoc flagelliforme CCNUN1]|uniref:Uncharacterized protein n=1 Tax=Nostoc flagelliforme CCNUN1 TaxID=2038116 RepID=A0A2K8T025_9NOSO|nr:hypothetical protein COO91_07080 [Nostoc flagelliforme CCNUN1]